MPGICGSICVTPAVLARSNVPACGFRPEPATECTHARESPHQHAARARSGASDPHVQQPSNRSHTCHSEAPCSAAPQRPTARCVAHGAVRCPWRSAPLRGAIRLGDPLRAARRHGDARQSTRAMLVGKATSEAHPAAGRHGAPWLSVPWLVVPRRDVPRRAAPL